MHLRINKILLTFALVSGIAGELFASREVPRSIDTTITMTFSNALPIQFWPIECDTYNQNEPSGVFYRCYEHKWQCDDEVIIQFTEDSLVEGDYDLWAFNAAGVQLAAADSSVQIRPDLGKTIYTFNFQADRYSICNERVYFKVRDFYNGFYLAQSDMHYFTPVVKDSILMTYYNHRNIFGLIYDGDLSPEARFYLRIPARFFHQRTPKEQTDIVLSNQIVTTSTTMFKQRYLETDYLPYYMHEKIELAIQHQFVEIFNKRWRQREPYEIQEGNMKSPFKMAKCYLNEEAYVQRSVL